MIPILVAAPPDTSVADPTAGPVLSAVGGNESTHSEHDRARTGSVPYGPGVSWRSCVVVSLALLVLAVLGGAGTAFAHDPIILTDTQTSPEAGPRLPDGTISFALYGTLNSAADTRGLRVHFDAGDSVDITLLIPDRLPENELPDSLLPTLRIDAPDDTARILMPTERVRFDESFSNTSYVRYLELDESAQAGEYRLTVTASAPARFTLAVGTTERFGTPVENVPNRGAGDAGVQRWYTTPPLTKPPTSPPPSSTVSSPAVSTTTTLANLVASTTAIASDVGVSDAPLQTTPEPGLSPDSGTDVIAIVIGALVVMAAGLAWLLLLRRRRDVVRRRPMRRSHR